MDSLTRLPPLEAAALQSALVMAAERLGQDFTPAPGPVSAGFFLRGPSEAKDPGDSTLVFVGGTAAAADFASLCRKRRLAGCLLILPFDVSANDIASELADSNIVIRAKNPKYAYALIAGALYPLSSWRGELNRRIGANAWAAEDAILGENTVVEPEVTVGRGAKIGKGCILMHGCSIGPHVIIGDGTVIREKAVVGDLGFGFAFDGDRPPLRLPQLGGVVLGKDVEVGAFSTIGAGTMRPTLIEDYVKISDHVHIAHNCRIGERSIITGGVIVSGSTSIGKNCWLALGAILRNRINLGDDVTVGLGAVVVGDVEAGKTVMGLPAKPVDRPAGRPVSMP